MKKIVVIGVIALFVGFQSAFGVESKLSSDNKEMEEDCEPCNNECDMELVKIIPYYGRGVLLTFSCKIKNVGENTCYGDIGYEVKGYLWRTNILIDAYSYILNGELDKGEEKDYSGSSSGIFFEGRFLPRFYRLRFRAYPDDSNMENNYLEAIYLVYGWSDWFQRYELIKTYRPVYNTNEI